MVDEKFNATMDKFKSKGLTFNSHGFSPYAKRISGIPYGYFHRSFWEWLKNSVGLL